MASKKALRQHMKAEAKANSAPPESNRFVLDAEAYDEFIELLDKPAEPSPKLVELFSRPSRFSS